MSKTTLNQVSWVRENTKATEKMTPATESQIPSTATSDSFILTKKINSALLKHNWGFGVLGF